MAFQLYPRWSLCVSRPALRLALPAQCCHCERPSWISSGMTFAYEDTSAQRKQILYLFTHSSFRPSNAARKKKVCIFVHPQRYARLTTERTYGRQRPRHKSASTAKGSFRNYVTLNTAVFLPLHPFRHTRSTPEYVEPTPCVTLQACPCPLLTPHVPSRDGISRRPP